MKARKRFGQHFLERAWVDKLVAAVAPRPGDSFLEIGPGRGALTQPLAVSGVPIRAIEIDRDLAAELIATAPANVTVVTGDMLALSPAELFGEGIGPEAGPEEASPEEASPEEASTAASVRVVGNLPYNVSSPILFRLLELWRETRRLVDATLMLQREVAIRIAATPGSGDYGPLSILTALHADVDMVLQLPPGAFRPPPKVHSSVIRLRFRPPAVDVGDYARFERLVRTLFQQRRKTTANALKPLLAPAPKIDADAAADANSNARAAAAPTADDLLRRAGIDPRCRPETLSLDDLARLSRVLA